MSSPAQLDEDEEEEVEFVSENPVRPVLECVDLRSDSEDERCSSSTLEDEVTCHRERVTSTLDRLAQQVAREKKQRENKCRAFKEKQILQKAHGQQELAFSSSSGINQEAKRCVDMWLKMPGVKPGAFTTGSGRSRPAALPRDASTRHTCPVINCFRGFDNVSLLDGHLKRFDHSPCDPTISLKGCPSDLFACVACSQYFLTKEEWRQHLVSKVSSSTPDGHSIAQPCQRIVCFACPNCYLFFNLRDECLQHMSDRNHFTQSLAMSEARGRALPVPIPQYVKNRLISLCKDVTFKVRCSLCYKELISHQAAQAHFNVQCRQGCAVAKADKTVVEVMKELQVRGQCSLCRELFFHQAEIERHETSTQHHVEVNRTMEKAVLQHCRFRESQPRLKATEAPRKKKPAGLESPHKPNEERSSSFEFSAKRQRLSTSVSVSSGWNSTAWFCECGLQFSEKADATKHLLAVNQIFHQCGVCGKHMGEPSIARLHMSRFHGGAHLSNFLFYCRKCNVEMPRYEDIMSHVLQDHRGHTYFHDQEVSGAVSAICEPKPSTSTRHAHATNSAVQQNVAETPSVKTEQNWMCRMCEDVFDSERDVRKHCSDVSGHSYQRFMCGHCPQKFFKESTVRRHCVNEHGGQMKSHHFCGLCDSMQFDSEGDFLEHYESLHSKDYYCIDDGGVVQPTVPESTSQPACPCMGSEKGSEVRKATYTQCMRELTHEGKCQYVCAPCDVSVPSYAQMKTHVHTKHPALNLDKTFEVECKTCLESFADVPSFHSHYHSLHCALEPCVSSRTPSGDAKAEPTPVKIVNAVELSSDSNEIEDETLVKFLNLEQANRAIEVHDELEEALQRSLVEF